MTRRKTSSPNAHPKTGRHTPAANATRRLLGRSPYSSSWRRNVATISCPAAASSCTNQQPVNELAPVNRILTTMLRGRAAVTSDSCRHLDLVQPLPQGSQSHKFVTVEFGLAETVLDEPVMEFLHAGGQRVLQTEIRQ